MPLPLHPFLTAESYAVLNIYRQVCGVVVIKKVSTGSVWYQKEHSEQLIRISLRAATKRIQRKEWVKQGSAA